MKRFVGGYGLERKCPNCGKALPEEAEFCLFCFTDIESFKKSQVRPVAATSRNGSCITALFGILKAKLTKKLFCRIGVFAAFLLVMGICIFAMKTINSQDSLKTNPGTTILKDTSAVAVTKENGETVTNTNGEQVFDIIEVTKVVTVSTTEKQGFFDKIFNSSSAEKENSGDKNNGSTLVETTKKESFFNKLFGDDDDETQPVTKPSTTQPSTEGNTENQSSTTTETPLASEKDTTKPVSTETDTTDVYTTESGSYYFEYEPQYESSPNGNIALTKYIGNAEIVTIPSYIDGRKVAVIKQNCFLDDPKIKEIRFDDSSSYTVMLYYHCFNNLTSLSKLVFNNKGFFTSTAFAYNCPIVYMGNDGKTNNLLIDGAYYLGNSFLWFTAHPSYTTLTIPSWCTKIDNAQNIHECPNLKVINIHKNVSNIQKSSLYYGDGLTAINVEPGHPEVFSSDGVLFYKWGNDSVFSCVYPYSKNDNSFKLPNNCYLSMGKGSIYTVNSYLEELWLPKTSFLSSPSSKDFYNNCYPNLKKIHIAENHPQYDDIKKTFAGELIVGKF